MASGGGRTALGMRAMQQQWQLAVLMPSCSSAGSSSGSTGRAHCACSVPAYRRPAQAVKSVAVPSLKLTVLPANLQFALVLLYSVLARNKPGMDPVVSLLFMCLLSMLRMLVPDAAIAAADAQVRHVELFMQVAAVSAVSAALPCKQPEGTTQPLLCACSMACTWATTRAS
jgi:hypothetical protein